MPKYLNIPKAKLSVAPSVAPSKTRAITGARVLTSSECLALIREKELKKKQQEEEKENRKKIREEKKKQREEDKLKKAEEKRKKEHERIKKVAEKEATKARKAEEKRQAEERKQAERNARQAQPSTSSSSMSTVQLRSRQQVRVEPVIVSNMCCVCQQSYEEDMELGGGVEWVQCSCLRWLHEDCVLDSSVSSDGKVQLCPFC